MRTVNSDSAPVAVAVAIVSDTKLSPAGKTERSSEPSCSAVPIPSQHRPLAAENTEQQHFQETKVGNAAMKRETESKILERRHLPEPPRGVEWTWNSASGRWLLVPVQEADVTAIDAAEHVPDFIPHSIQESDTLAGICLKYGVTATQLRRANYAFSGNNLSLAPNPLRIPNIRKARPQVAQEDQQKQLRAMRLLFGDRLAETEIKCYLALNDWNILQAANNAEQDLLEKDFSVDPVGERARFDTPIQSVVIDEGM